MQITSGRVVYRRTIIDTMETAKQEVLITLGLLKPKEN